MGESLHRERRLRSKRDFQALRERGLSQSHRIVVLRAVPNSLSFSRLGFVVGRRVAKAAVTRNLVRRRMREVARRTCLQPGWDLLFIARPAARTATFAELRGGLLAVMDRAKLLIEQPGRERQS